MPAVPMIDDIALSAVQVIRQSTSLDLAPAKVMGLAGRVHQNFGRSGHRVELSGLLLGETAGDDLAALQEKAAGGEEVAFVSDITVALEIETMVIAAFEAEQRVGPASQYFYRVVLEESPELPPPAEVSSFGGLPGLGDAGLPGLDDLGFDAGALGDLASDLQDQAAGVMGALDDALDVLEQLEGLTGLVDLGSVGNVLGPVTDEIAGLGEAGSGTAGLGDAIGRITGGGGS
ncbi:hypothetical protein [Sedimentitalea arenosa]|jgi:hypothetical protein|uniref:DNA circulation N-terminal domain-containing protein n=1 Tax=Sedimentitalea arenosa TaxID=2798803 RepID=A0A8J7J4U0_9RHOB|nr:hypothetical protein [Arenibacterium arenosum]MBJ6369937.1 hypothetical protein [Arenibacterium arenosum]